MLLYVVGLPARRSGAPHPNHLPEVESEEGPDGVDVSLWTGVSVGRTPSGVDHWLVPSLYFPVGKDWLWPVKTKLGIEGQSYWYKNNLV